MNYPKMATFRTAEALRARFQELGITLGLDDTLEPGPQSPMGRPFDDGTIRVGNRWAILPMEGWDGTVDGHPTDLTRRRWHRFGLSGAKLIWGGEAVAVRPDGRANPNQLVLSGRTQSDLAALREVLVGGHREATGGATDLYVGLQLTHSGRFARPNDKSRLEPRVLYRNPLLERRYPLGPEVSPLTDGEIEGLVEDVVAAAVRAQQAGFDFVDIKHCHGYLGHEFLSAVDRPGPYGGSLENRSRFLRTIVDGIRRDAPGLGVGVRLSLFDRRPCQPGPGGVGQPMDDGRDYRWSFGGHAALERDGEIAWDEPVEFLRRCVAMGIRLFCFTAGSPYYNPHIQRPAMVPPSDGYQPPEDPLVGVARQIRAVARAKEACPGLVTVGSGYSYLQEWLPHVAQHQVRVGETDFVGIGRMVLSYPELPLDVLTGRVLQRRRICRTFSECTSGPRNGLVSGCFPLDGFYRDHPDAERLRERLRAGQNPKV